MLKAAKALQVKKGTITTPLSAAVSLSKSRINAYQIDERCFSLYFYLLWLRHFPLFLSFARSTLLPRQSMPFTCHRSDRYIELMSISLISHVQVVLPHNARHVQTFLYTALGSIQVSQVVRAVGPAHSRNWEWSGPGVILDYLTKSPRCWRRWSRRWSGAGRRGWGRQRRWGLDKARTKRGILLPQPLKLPVARARSQKKSPSQKKEEYSGGHKAGKKHIEKRRKASKWIAILTSSSGISCWSAAVEVQWKALDRTLVAAHMAARPSQTDQTHPFFFCSSFSFFQTFLHHLPPSSFFVFSTFPYFILFVPFSPLLRWIGKIGMAKLKRLFELHPLPPLLPHPHSSNMRTRPRQLSSEPSRCFFAADNDRSSKRLFKMWFPAQNCLSLSPLPPSLPSS